MNPVYSIIYSYLRGEQLDAFPKGISTKGNTTSSGIWTRVIDSIFDDENHYF